MASTRANFAFTLSRYLGRKLQETGAARDFEVLHSSGSRLVTNYRWFRTTIDRNFKGQEVYSCEVREKTVRTVTFTVLAPHKAAPHNRYQPHPAEPEQHTTCSNIRLVLLKMGIMMPETCWEIVENKHLTAASCWFSLLLHNLLTMHGHRNLKSILLELTGPWT